MHTIAVIHLAVFRLLFVSVTEWASITRKISFVSILFFFPALFVLLVINVFTTLVCIPFLYYGKKYKVASCIYCQIELNIHNSYNGYQIHVKKTQNLHKLFLQCRPILLGIHTNPWISPHTYGCQCCCSKQGILAAGLMSQTLHMFSMLGMGLALTRLLGSRGRSHEPASRYNHYQFHQKLFW